MSEFRKTKYYLQVFKLEEEYFLKSLKKIYDIDNEIEIIYVIKNDSLVSFLTYKLYELGCDIFNLLVVSSSQNQGLATTMLGELYKFDITLEVCEDNTAACTLYKKLGFEIFDKHENYYGAKAALKMIRRSSESSL